MAKDTRERILEAALEIFSRDGYSGTNIKDIADAVGIVKSALYRHFDSKEEIFDAVINMMVTYYDDHFGSIDKLPHIPESTVELFEMTFKMIDFTVHDKKVIQMRKILLTEQFRDGKVRELANKYFLYDTGLIFAKLFEGMMKNGSLKTDDPAMLAFAYTSPITVLIHLCDRDPEKEPEAIDRMKEFIRHFISQYGCR